MNVAIGVVLFRRVCFSTPHPQPAENSVQKHTVHKPSNPIRRPASPVAAASVPSVPLWFNLSSPSHHRRVVIQDRLDEYSPRCQINWIQ